MRNLILIGPPASGKLTIARALADSLGLFLYDNHRSIDAAKLLARGQARHPQGLVNALRRAVMELAVRQGIPLVFTLVYDHPGDDKELDDYVSILTGERPPLVVQLHCPRSVAMERATDASRQGTSKLRTAEGIERLYTSYNLETDYRPAGPDVLHIDSDVTPAEQSIEQITARLLAAVATKV